MLPAVPGEPCLLFCAQVTILGLAFGANAFAHIDTVDQLAALRPNAGSNNLPLLWKKSKSEEPFFESLQTYHQTHNYLDKLGSYVGFGLPLSFYCFRRGAGDSFENSGMTTHQPIKPNPVTDRLRPHQRISTQCNTAPCQLSNLSGQLYSPSYLA